MLSIVKSMALHGLDGYLVNVEVDVSNGLPSWEIVGLPDVSVKEAKDRVRTAIKNSGYEIQSRKIVVNLAPANTKKEGPYFDLPIAIGIIIDLGYIKCEQINEYVFIGELSLSGKIKANLIFVNKLDAIDHAEIEFDFIEKQQQSVELNDIYAEDDLTLKNVSFSGTEAILVFEHCVKLSGNYAYEIPMFSNENNDFVIKNSSFESQKFVTLAEDNFTVAEETEVNIVNANILSNTASVVISEVNCLVDKISLEGKILSTIV